MGGIRMLLGFAVWVVGWFLASAVGALVAWKILEAQRRLEPMGGIQPPGMNLTDLTPEDLTTIQKWIARNPWYSGDVALQLEAQSIHVRLLRERQDLTMRDNLTRVTSEMARRHPDEVRLLH